MWGLGAGFEMVRQFWQYMESAVSKLNQLPIERIYYVRCVVAI